MPSSCAARTTRRSASTPRRWPSARGKPRAAAQRPLPSMMTATCKGPSVRSGPSVAGAAAFDIDQSLNGEDFFFLGRKQVIDLRNRPVGCLLDVGSQTFLFVLRNLVILLELLYRIEAVAADVPDCDARGFGIFVRDLHEFLAPVFIELGNSQAQHLPFGRRAEAKIGIDDRLFNGLDHRLVPNLHRKQARLRHTDGR